MQTNIFTITITVLITTLTLISMESKKETQKPSNLELQMQAYEKQLDLQLIESAEKLSQKAVFFRSKVIELEKQNQRLKSEIRALKQDKIAKEFHL